MTAAGKVLLALSALLFGAAAGPDRRAPDLLSLDAHADIPAGYGQGLLDPGRDGTSQVDLPKLERGRIGAVMLAVFVAQGEATPEAMALGRGEAMAKIAAIRGIATGYPGRAAIARSADDVLVIRRSGRVAIIPTMLNAYPFDRDPDALEHFVRAAGIRMVGLVHLGHNGMADSARPAAGQPPALNGGLSPLGREAVARLNRAGVVVDVAQMSEAALRQAVRLSAAPVVASHVGIRALVDHPRNLTDGEIDEIGRSGGVVGIVAFGRYLRFDPPAGYADAVAAIHARHGLKPGESDAALPIEERRKIFYETEALVPPASVANMVDAIDHVVRRIGVAHVAISSDFNHGGGIEGFRNEGDAQAITLELRRRGYDARQIAMIWSGNMLRAMRAAEAVGRRLARERRVSPRR